MAKMKVDARAYITLWIFVALSVGLYFLGKQIGQEQIKNFIQGFGIFGPLVYILAHQLTYIVAPINGLPFLITGYYLFGPTAIIYQYVSFLSGMTIDFFIARLWGRSVVKRLAGEKSLEKIDELEQEYGIAALIFVRLLWQGIGDFVSYAYGLTNIKFRQYFIISATFAIPNHVIWYFLAARSESIEGFLFFSYILTFVGAASFLIWKKFHDKKRRN